MQIITAQIVISLKKFVYSKFLYKNFCTFGTPLPLIGGSLRSYVRTFVRITSLKRQNTNKFVFFAFKTCVFQIFVVPLHSNYGCTDSTYQ